MSVSEYGMNVSAIKYVFFYELDYMVVMWTLPHTMAPAQPLSGEEGYSTFPSQKERFISLKKNQKRIFVRKYLAMAGCAHDIKAVTDFI